MTEKVAFIGLGVMGYPMAGWLAKAGHEVTVFNRTQSKAAAWAEEYGGRAASTVAEAAQAADFVMSCVGYDPDVRETVLGSGGVIESMASGGVFVDHTTASAGVAREIAEAGSARGIGCIDAPVSGGQAGAENGQLTVMCGGEPSAYDRAEPIMQAYAKSVRLLGDAGAGQLTKMVNQIAIAGLVQGLAEALNFATRAGLDEAAVIDVISKGAAQSWQMENRGKTMCRGEFEFGFAVDWMRKDLSICLQEAGNNGARLPATALIDQFYAQVQARGGNRWDTSSLMHLLAND